MKYVVATRAAAFVNSRANRQAEGVHAPPDLRVDQKITDRMSRAAPYERCLED
jgi:hypothetical protein